MKKEFPLAVVMSVVMGKILVTQISEIRKFCSFMVGQEVYSNQISRAVKEIQIDVLKQLPIGLQTLDRNEINEISALSWLRDKEVRFGNMLALSPILGKKFDFSDPVGDMSGSVPTIVIF